jgi:(2Fe-2S) ferredoxin
LQVFICGNRRPAWDKRGSCAAKGSEKIRDYMRARVAALGLAVRVDRSGCLDRCEHGPCAVFYTDGVWYRLDSFAAVDEVLQKHVLEGGRVQALMLPD